MSVKKAIIAGYISLDFYPDLSPSLQHLIEDDLEVRPPIEIDQASYTAGGVVPGVGFALHDLGIPSSLIGKVGDDLFGETVKRIISMKDPQLLEGIISDPAVPTGHRIWIDPIQYFPGANNTFYASDIPRDVLRGADLFHFGYPALMRSIYRSEGGELVSILQRVRREGLSTSLDFGLPDPESQGGKVDWVNILENTLPLVDVFIPDIWQLLLLLKPERFHQLAGKNQNIIDEVLTPDLLDQLGEWVLDRQVKILLVDLGEIGLYLRTNGLDEWGKTGRGLADLGEEWYGREIWLPSIDIKKGGHFDPHEVVVAGFLAGMLRGDTPEKSLLLSAAARRSALEKIGDSDNLPPEEELLKRADQDLEFSPLQLEKFNFRKGKDGIWER